MVVEQVGSNTCEECGKEIPILKLNTTTVRCNLCNDCLEKR